MQLIRIFHVFVNKTFMAMAYLANSVILHAVNALVLYRVNAFDVKIALCNRSMGFVLSKKNAQLADIKIHKGNALFVGVFVNNVQMISFV